MFIDFSVKIKVVSKECFGKGKRDASIIFV